MPLAFHIAFRHLKAPQKGSFSTFAGILAILGLGMGITALILTFAVLKGFENTISQKIAGFDGHIRIQHFMDQPMRENDAFLDSVIRQSPFPMTVQLYIQKPALLRKGSRAEGVIVEGIGDGSKFAGLSSILVSGELDLSPGSIIMGNRLADQLKVGVGDKLVLFDLESITRVSTAQRFRQYRITGLFHSGLLEYDKTVVYLSLADAQTLFNMPGQVSGRIITLDDMRNVRPVYRYLETNLGYPYYLLSWKEKHRVLFDWMSLQKWPILFIFGMIAFVGVVNIISVLAMIVIEKMREIGTLLALGLTPARIKRLFLLEGAIIGVIGSVFGGVLAVGLAYLQIKFQIISLPEDVYFMDNVPVEIHWGVTGIIIAIGIISSIVAALGPTIKASRVKPAEALRYE
ncbi:MAG: ABC transporter permease [FCB group bacterium]|nr:ABC transporter permease [FCB group bacterium]